MIILNKLFQRLKQIRRFNKDEATRYKHAEVRDGYYINKLIPEVKISDEKKLQQIKDFWKPYEFAYKNNPMTQIAFYNQSGVFDPSYIGFGLQRWELVRFWNNETFSTFRNKNYSKYLFPFVKQIKSYVSCSYGNYYDEECNILTRQQAIDKICETLKTEKELILKPTLDSGSGASITFVSEKDDRASIINKISKLEPHFVCQEILKNHETLKICGNALNTIRVCTLNYNNEIKYVGAVFRMSTGKRIDNWDAGGIVCRVKEDGSLDNFAISGNGTKYTVHPNGFKFSGHKLYKGAEVLAIAIKCHKRIPQQKYISWDFTVDEKGEIVFVEMNSPGGSEVVQSVGINAYINQDITKSILDNFLYMHKATLEWDYREFANKVICLKYHGGGGQVTIPRSINNKPGELVAASAFNESNIKEIVISKDIKFIDSIVKKRNIKVSIV